MNVVIHGDDGVVSLLVDKIGDVVTVDSDRFESPPDTLTGPQRFLSSGPTNSNNNYCYCLIVKHPFRL